MVAEDTENLPYTLHPSKFFSNYFSSLAIVINTDLTSGDFEINWFVFSIVIEAIFSLQFIQIS